MGFKARAFLVVTVVVDVAVFCRLLLGCSNDTSLVVAVVSSSSLECFVPIVAVADEVAADDENDESPT
jgi:hypothetical protein